MLSMQEAEKGKTVMATTADIERMLDMQAEKICQRMQKETSEIINQEMNGMKKEIEKVNVQVKNNSDKLTNLENKNYQLDLLSRRKNAVMFNVNEDPDGEPRLTDKVISLLKEGTNDEICAADIDTIYRIGKKTNKIRPILIKFISERAKKVVMRNIKNFIAKKMSVYDDVPKELSDLRKKFNPLITKLRSENKKVYVSVDKFEVDKMVWSWQKATEQLGQLNKRNRSPESSKNEANQESNSASGAIPKRFAHYKTYDACFQPSTSTPRTPTKQ